MGNLQGKQIETVGQRPGGEPQNAGGKDRRRVRRPHHHLIECLLQTLYRRRGRTY